MLFDTLPTQIQSCLWGWMRIGYMFACPRSDAIDPHGQTALISSYPDTTSSLLIQHQQRLDSCKRTWKTLPFFQLTSQVWQERPAGRTVPHLPARRYSNETSRLICAPEQRTLRLSILTPSL